MTGENGCHGHRRDGAESVGTVLVVDDENRCEATVVVDRTRQDLRTALGRFDHASIRGQRLDSRAEQCMRAQGDEAGAQEQRCAEHDRARGVEAFGQRPSHDELGQQHGRGDQKPTCDQDYGQVEQGTPGARGREPSGRRSDENGGGEGCADVERDPGTADPQR